MTTALEAEIPAASAILAEEIIRRLDRRVVRTTKRVEQIEQIGPVSEQGSVRR